MYVYAEHQYINNSDGVSALILFIDLTSINALIINALRTMKALCMTVGVYVCI